MEGIQGTAEIASHRTNLTPSSLIAVAREPSAVNCLGGSELRV